MVQVDADDDRERRVHRVGRIESSTQADLEETYDAIEQGLTELLRGELLNDERLAECKEQYGRDGFEYGIGAEAVRKLLNQLDRLEGVKANFAGWERVNFVVGAIPDTLLDSELFGHEKGAFTGALARKRGRFERAHKGTILLDEIGDTSPALQMKLLRVLESKEIRPLGDTQTIRVDVRVVSATHRNLEAAIEDLSLFFDIGHRIASGDEWPQWYEGNEFRALGSPPGRSH